MKTIHYTPLIFLSICFVGCTKGLEEKITSLEAEKSTFQEKISTLETEKSTFQEKITSLEAEKSTFQEKISTLETEKSKLTDANSNLNQKLELANKEIKTFVDNLKKAENKLKESEIEVAKLQGKWEALEQEKERAEKEAANKSNLIVQLGVRMQSGDTIPVKGTKVYLAKESFYSIVGRNMTYVDGGGRSKSDKTEMIWGGGLGQFSILSGSAARSITSKVQSKAQFIASTDFLGKVEFSEIPKGDYYIICGTGLGQGFGVVWSKKIQLKSGKNTFSFDQGDGL